MKNAFKGHINRLSQAKNELEYRSIKLPKLKFKEIKE